ncbi:MAG: STAS domain-containing protein [Planctomycetota bacterium]|jgi:anti-sigma B factor antagonist
MALSIRTTKPTDFSLKISFVGNLDNETVDGFEQEMQRLLANPYQTVILDCQELEFVSSSGIGAIMKLRSTLSRSHTELVTINLPPHIKKVLEIMKLVPVMNVFENVEELDRYLKKVQEKIIKEGAE